jgi:ornithine cyclodeaminase/alanine dehydrogenase-like protein (mu-crystallin family)
MMKVRFLTAAEVRAALPMTDAIAGMKMAYAALSTGQADMPLRSQVNVAEQQATSLVMPAYLNTNGSPSLAVKVVSVFPGNVRRGEPVIYALVLVLHAASGRPLCIMEGASLTAIRTGAASGAATDVLARPEAAVAAIFGSGVQARTQLEAICTVRRIREVRVFSLDEVGAGQFVCDMEGRSPIPDTLYLASSADEAVQGADVICTATTSATPVFNGRSLTPGAHVNGVGSYLPTMQEVDAETVQRSLVVVDSVTAVLAEAGDLIQPIRQGQITPDHIHAELGQIIAGRKPGRTSPAQITFFKSVGIAVQDAAAAQIALENAEKLGLGTEIEL